MIIELKHIIKVNYKEDIRTRIEPDVKYELDLDPINLYHSDFETNTAFPLYKFFKSTIDDSWQACNGNPKYITIDKLLSNFIAAGSETARYIEQKNKEDFNHNEHEIQESTSVLTKAFQDIDGSTEPQQVTESGE